jgi:hypothetical protein
MARGRSQFATRDRIRIRRILSNIGPEAEREVLSAYDRHGPAILAYARSEVPSRSGKLRAALAFKIFPKTLRFRIGLLTKAVQRRVWYARILEYGRKSQVAKVKRRRPVSGGVAVYLMKIRAIPAGRYDFVRGRTDDFMQRTLGEDLRKVLGRALKRISAGG